MQAAAATNMIVARLLLTTVLLTTYLVSSLRVDPTPPNLRDPCKLQPIQKRFSLQDPQNRTCTLTVPALRCNGICQTESLPSREAQYNALKGTYEVKEVVHHCKCCQGTNITRNAKLRKVLECEEGYNWTGHQLKIDLVTECACVSCQNTETRLP